MQKSMQKHCRALEIGQFTSVFLKIVGFKFFSRALTLTCVCSNAVRRPPLCAPLHAQAFKTTPPFFPLSQGRRLAEEVDTGYASRGGRELSYYKKTLWCGAHFQDNAFLPSLGLSDDGQGRRRRLVKDVVRSLFSFKPPLPPPCPSLADRLVSGAERAREIDEKKQSAIADAAAAQSEGERQAREERAEARKQIEEYKKQMEEMERRLASLECENASFALSHTLFENVKGDDEKLRHLSGLSLVQWEALLKVLAIESNEDILTPKCAANEERGRKNGRGAGRPAVVPLEDQLLMTLMRIWLGWLQQELAYIFGASEACVSLTFKKWISFLYLRLGRLPLWASWEDVNASMAECFRTNYPDTFIVLDATELCTEIHSCLALQSQLYSSRATPL